MSFIISTMNTVMSPVPILHMGRLLVRLHHYVMTEELLGLSRPWLGLHIELKMSEASAEISAWGSHLLIDNHQQLATAILNGVRPSKYKD